MGTTLGEKTVGVVATMTMASKGELLLNSDQLSPCGTVKNPDFSVAAVDVDLSEFSILADNPPF